MVPVIGAIGFELAPPAPLPDEEAVKNLGRGMETFVRVPLTNRNISSSSQTLPLT